MRIIRTAVTALAMAAVFSSLAGPAAAFTPRLEALFERFIDCKMLLLTDLQAHARECGGGTMPTTFESLSGRVDGAPPQQTPVATEPPKKHECYCDGERCDGDYEMPS